jgi:hypothetical protein
MFDWVEVDIIQVRGKSSSSRMACSLESPLPDASFAMPPAHRGAAFVNRQAAGEDRLD